MIQPGNMVMAKAMGFGVGTLRTGVGAEDNPIVFRFGPNTIGLVIAVTVVDDAVYHEGSIYRHEALVLAEDRLGWCIADEFMEAEKDQ